jgi:clan AA aspartic protease
MAKLKVTNSTDRELVARGSLSPDKERSIEVEALVDTGATMLVLPAEIVRAVGLRELGRRRVRLADHSVREVSVVGGVLIEILGRQMTCDALVMPEGTPALIGQIPLEGLDLVVDPKSREVRVNPASPDVPLMDLYSVGPRAGSTPAFPAIESVA